MKMEKGDGRERLAPPLGLSRRPGGRREEEASGVGWEAGCFFRGFLEGLDGALVVG
jgi:hypothetical protein